MSHINFLSAKRKSVRRYTKAAVTQEEIQDILSSALRAPTAKNQRGTYFVVVEDRERLRRLSACKPSGGAFVADAALAVAVCADPQREPRAYIDCAIAASYIQLAVTDLDLGSCWCHIHEIVREDGETAEAYVRRELNLPEDARVLCLIAIGGAADKDLEPRDRELEWERVYIEQYEERGTQR